MSINAVKADWQLSTSVDELANSTHLWAIELRKSPVYLNELERWLSFKEQQRANRIVIADKRNYQIQSRAWLRWLLAKYTNSSVKNISYYFGQRGKPYLDSQTHCIHFNATDSGETLLIAFHQSSELGLDIEIVPREVSYRKIARRKLTPNEFNILTALPESQQSEAFLALWTRKEGYGKAIGEGIHYAMNKITLCDDITSDSHTVHSSNNQTWYLQQIAGENFIACLVSQKPAGRINFYRLDVDSLDLTDV